MKATECPVYISSLLQIGLVDNSNLLAYSQQLLWLYTWVMLAISYFCLWTNPSLDRKQGNLSQHDPRIKDHYALNDLWPRRSPHPPLRLNNENIGHDTASQHSATRQETKTRRTE